MRVIRLNPEQPRAQRWEERRREAAERMEKRERVCSHSKKGEEVQGKRSESEGEADAELKAGGEAGFFIRTELPGRWDWGRNLS